ncbi:hypothetical protein FKM82_020241 [Ascaphus truei]
MYKLFYLQYGIQNDQFKSQQHTVLAAQGQTCSALTIVMPASPYLLQLYPATVMFPHRIPSTYMGAICQNFPAIKPCKSLVQIIGAKNK